MLNREESLSRAILLLSAPLGIKVSLFHLFKDNICTSLAQLRLQSGQLPSKWAHDAFKGRCATVGHFHSIHRPRCRRAPSGVVLTLLLLLEVTVWQLFYVPIRQLIPSIFVYYILRLLQDALATRFNKSLRL